MRKASDGGTETSDPAPRGHRPQPDAAQHVTRDRPAVRAAWYAAAVLACVLPAVHVLPGARAVPSDVPAAVTPPSDTRAGRARLPANAQASDIRVFHQSGQTFVLWTELAPAPPATLTYAELFALRKALTDRRIRYRVYRSDTPIRQVSEARLAGEVGPMSGWNAEHEGDAPPPAKQAGTFVVENGKPPVASGTGILVVNPEAPRASHYAVTAVVDGVEDTRLSAGNTTETPITEHVGDGVPVLQRIERPPMFNFIEGATLRYFVRWEPAKHSSIPGRPYDYVVGIPPGVRSPAPVGIHMHAWGGSLTREYGWWFNAEKGAVLVASNDFPYDWWTGYHEQFGKGSLTTPATWRAGVVRPYTQRRLLAFVDWLATTMPVDRTRVFAAGMSMGGSGAIMLAIRQPERIAWATSWVGIHVPHLSPQYKSSYELVYGLPEWGVRFEDGTPVWDYFNDVWYLRRHPERDIGFISFSNGRNDSAIGWQQAVDFIRALQETRQPHKFSWGMEGHGQRAYMPAAGGERVMPLDLRIDQSLPAFTRGTLDDDPGTGAADSGRPQGHVNGYLAWKPETIVDEADRWSIVITLIEQSPQPTAAVDVTPRRLQRFTLKPGDRVEWRNAVPGAPIQTGTAVADQWGLITLPQVRVTRGDCRITVTRHADDRTRSRASQRTGAGG